MEKYNMLLNTCQALFSIEVVCVERFGEKVRMLRHQQGMTLKQLAEAVGVASFSYLSDIEHGKKTPHATLIIKIANVFGVTADQLMRDEIELD